jgi:hypothetical protein
MFDSSLVQNNFFRNPEGVHVSESTTPWLVITGEQVKKWFKTNIIGNWIESTPSIQNECLSRIREANES